MKYLLIIAVLVAVIAFRRNSAMVPSAKAEVEVVVGGVYATRQDDGKFQFSKILAADDEAVHLRFYEDPVTEIPKFVATKDLHVIIGHAPVSRSGWLKDKPVLVVKEKVLDDELEGYKIYQSLHD